MTDYEALHYDKDKLRQACKETHTHTKITLTHFTNIVGTKCTYALVPTMFVIIKTDHSN